MLLMEVVIGVVLEFDKVILLANPSREVAWEDVMTVEGVRD